MKRMITLAAMFLGLLSVRAQSVSNSHVLLSGYTFTDKRPVVGTLAVSGGVTATRFALKGENAGAFTISKKNELVIGSKQRKSNEKWYDIVVEAETSNGTLQDTFRIVKDQFIKNKVIAHRGAWKNTNVPQNSIASLQHAVRLGCEGSEFDMYMSADGVVFINHDPHYQGVLIDSASSEQLAALKLSNGESLPTLEAYLIEGMKQTSTKLVLEIKANKLSKERVIALTDQVVHLVRKHKAQAWALYISFNFDCLKRIKELDPYAPVQYLNGDKAPDELIQAGFEGLDYNFKILQAKPDWINQAHKNKLEVNVWTVNDPAMMDKFLEQKVEYITTDEPEILLEKMQRR